MNSKIRLPLLLICAVLVLLAMLRLGVWQLERAEQKNRLLEQLQSRTSEAAMPFGSIDFQASTASELRYTNTEVTGRYLGEGTVFIDNYVVAGKVGYQIFSPFLPVASQQVVLVNRGWISVGESRQKLPAIATPTTPIKLKGRLNLPPPQPPLWNDDYAVAQGAVWAYLPIAEYAAEFQLDVLPIVLELAPEKPFESQLTMVWANIDDEWVAKHHGYAFQWFAMAAAFLVICVVLLIRRSRAVDSP